MSKICVVNSNIKFLTLLKMVAAGFKLRKIRTVHTLGEKLRRARKRKGVDLIEAELSTKVRAKYLEALENEDFDLLPNDIYTKGFLTTYAEYLGLESKKIVNLWEQQTLLKNKTVDDDFRTNKTLKEKAFVITPRIIALFIGAVFCLSAVIYIIFQVISFASVPKLAIDSPSKDMVVETDQVLVSGKTDAGVNLAVNKEPIIVGSDGRFGQYIALQNGINTIVITATNKANKEDSKVFVVERKSKTAEAK
ncbi:MAG: helix-turn-helix domain-containing protein [Candidatus Berkelbacteria bacterium]|nr:helix-turn-helix domain-containing protein [Candidatus Berkelbacteria bacterium]